MFTHSVTHSLTHSFTESFVQQRAWRALLSRWYQVVWAGAGGSPEEEVAAVHEGWWVTWSLGDAPIVCFYNSRWQGWAWGALQC